MLQRCRLCLQEVAQLEAETQQIFQENQQLNKQSNALNQDVSLPA